jgi:type II secretory pathway component GspD/PulD (secretin)
MVVSAVCLTVLGLATLGYVELSAGPGETRSNPGASPAVVPASAVASAPARAPAPAPVVPEDRPSAPADVRPVEAQPAAAVVVPVRPASPTRPSVSAYEATGRLSQAESAVFHGRFARAEDILSSLDRGAGLSEEHRAWMDRIRGRMTAARAQIRRAEEGAVRPVGFAFQEEKKADEKKDEKPAEKADAKPEDKKDEKSEEAPKAKDPDPAGILLDEAKNFDQLIREMVEAEFAKRMESARELLAKEDFDRAISTADTAIALVRANGLYLLNRGADMIAQAEAFKKQVLAVKERITANMKRDRELKDKIDAAGRSKREHEEKVRRVKSFLRNAEDALREGDPARALEMYDLVLKIDPSNVAAVTRKEIVSDMYDHLVQAGIRRTLARQEVFTSTDMLEGKIPWYHEVRLPADWDELSRRRLERVIEDEDPAAIRERERLDRAARRLLNTIKPALVLPGIPLNQAIDFIRETWGANIFVNWQAIQDAGVDPEQLVNLNLKDVSLRTAIETVFDLAAGKLEPTARPTFIVDAGIIHISTRELLNQRTATIVYDITDLVLVERIPEDPQAIQLSQFAQGQGVFAGGAGGGGGMAGPGAGIFGGGAGAPTFSAAQEEEARKALITQIIDIIKTVDPEAFAGEGGDLREFNGVLIVRNTRANHERIRKLLADLRSISQKQVSIEARFVQIDSAIVEQVLFDFDVNFSPILGPGNFLQLINNGGAGSTGPFSPAVPDPDPMLPPAPGGGLPIPHPVDLFSFNSTKGGTTFGQSQAAIDGNAIGTLINGAILDDVGVRFFMQATQAANRVSLYTAPKITVLNGRKATIAVRQFQPYVANVKSNVGGGIGAVGIDPIIQLAVSGTTMWIRPVISHDNRFVTLQMNPVLLITNLDSINSFGVTNNNGGNAGFIDVNGNGVFDPGIDIPGGGNSVGAITLQQPRTFEQNVFTTVKVPDKGTVVLGGFKTSNETERELGTPMVSKIPLLKRLFSNRSLGREDSILLILVRPTIHLYEEIDPYYELRPGARN